MRNGSNVIQNEAKNLGSIKHVLSRTFARLCSALDGKFVLVIFIFLFTACEHRPLVELDIASNRRWVRVYLDENIRNVTYGFYNEALPKPAYRTPEVMRVMLCASETGSIVSEVYLRDKGRDERGNYLEGTILAPPGIYRLLAYNFDTESVHVGNEYDYKNMYAYTNPISAELYGRLGSVRTASSEADWRIVYEPDHFFVENNETITITEDTDTLCAEVDTHFMATSTVKSYYLQVQVKGVELATSAVALLSGMGGSVKVCDGSMIPDDPVAVHFGLQHGVDKDNPEKKVAYTTFHTFGKLEEQENHLAITFEFYAKNGQTYSETIPLTDLFKTEMIRVNQWIIIDKVIDLEEALYEEGQESGGMTPEVGEWENVEGDIYI